MMTRSRWPGNDTVPSSRRSQIPALSDPSTLRSQRYREFENRPRIGESLAIEISYLVHPVAHRLRMDEQVCGNCVTLP